MKLKSIPFSKENEIESSISQRVINQEMQEMYCAP